VPGSVYPGVAKPAPWPPKGGIFFTESRGIRPALCFFSADSVVVALDAFADHGFLTFILALVLELTLVLDGFDRKTFGGLWFHRQMRCLLGFDVSIFEYEFEDENQSVGGEHEKDYSASQFRSSENAVGFQKAQEAADNPRKARCSEPIRAEICSQEWLAERVNRSRADPLLTLGKRIAGTRKPSF
jgi:hypothetical protein